MRNLYILRIDSYEDDDTYIRCGNDLQNHLFCIVKVDPKGRAEIVDNGYRTYDEALEAWPEAESGKD